MAFRISYPPRAFAESVDNDVAEPLAWGAVPPMALWWLPLDSVIRRARLDRWQDLSAERVAEVGRGKLPVFISHRWLAVDQPDPSGRQARLLAWHLVAAIGEAANIAATRGLHEPRRRSVHLGRRVGPGGAYLAEAILVAVVRPAVDKALLGELVAEARSLEELFGDDLVSFAEADNGLATLRDALRSRPRLAALTSRIYLWIDFCSLPQPPRSQQEQVEFDAALRLANTVQLLGLTVILLDEVEDYTRRAWCLLEAMTAYRWPADFDVVSGLPENTDPLGGPYKHLSDLLLDLPQVVWRALLDAELFGVIDWREAMRRLDIDVTDPNDLPYIYDRLRAIPAPNRLHTLAGDLVTGIFPLPQITADRVLVPNDLGGELVAEVSSGVAVSLGWGGALDLSERARLGLQALRRTPHMSRWSRGAMLRVVVLRRTSQSWLRAKERRS